MLAIKVELHPFGEADDAKNIATMLIWNDGKGTREYGSYGVALLKEGVSVEDGRDLVRTRYIDLSKEEDVLVYTTVTDHERALPVWALVKEALTNAEHG